MFGILGEDQSLGDPRINVLRSRSTVKESVYIFRNINTLFIVNVLNHLNLICAYLTYYLIMALKVGLSYCKVIFNMIILGQIVITGYTKYEQIIRSSPQK